MRGPPPTLGEALKLLRIPLLFHCYDAADSREPWIHVPVWVSCLPPGSLLPSFDGYYETDGPYQGPAQALARGHGDSFLFLIALDNNFLITAAVQDCG
jgi:hypothetical protein